MPKKNPEQIPVISNPAFPNPVVISKESATEKSHIPAQISNSSLDSPVISTTEGRRNPILSEVSESSDPSNSPVISNPASAGEKSHTKAKHFRVTNSDVYYKGKAYPEGSIVDFQDDHLSKYLIPIDENNISPEDIVYDTITEPFSIDTSLDPKYVASRRRGRPRQL